MPWRRDRLLMQVFLSFPGASAGKESACNVGDLGSIPELGRSSGEGNNYPLQYSCLENSTERVAWQATVHGVTKSQTRLSNFHFSVLLGLELFCPCSWDIAIDRLLLEWTVLAAVLEFNLFLLQQFSSV